MAVVIPARDEAELISDCLDAMSGAAVAAQSRGYDVQVVVVADRCRDRTEVIARSAGATVLSVNSGSVGLARAAGVAAVLADWDPSLTSSLWLANTDADSRVPAGWLTAQIEAAGRGAEACVGTVALDPTGIDPVTHRQWENSYRRGGREARLSAHGHVHGANVGVRADAYLAVGGFPPVDHDEDRGLVRRLAAAGRLVEWTTEGPVVTAARTHGRAPHGVSADLAAIQARPVTAG